MFVVQQTQMSELAWGWYIIYLKAYENKEWFIQCKLHGNKSLEDIMIYFNSTFLVKLPLEVQDRGISKHCGTWIVYFYQILFQGWSLMYSSCLHFPKQLFDFLEDPLTTFCPSPIYLEILNPVSHQFSGTCYINSKIKVGWKPKHPHAWSEI